MNVHIEEVIMFLMSSFHGNLGSNCSKFIEKLIWKMFDLKDLEARLWLKRSILEKSSGSVQAHVHVL